MPESASIETLRTNVRTAVGVELTTLPTYLYPYWSIRPTYDGGSEAGQQARTAIMSVILEEMLHMGLVSNLLNAIGGTPQFTSGPNFPKFPGHILSSKDHGDHGVPVDLLPLGDEALDLMLRIELPDWDPHEGMTIGDFYDEHVLKLLPTDDAAYLGPDGKPVRQLAPWDNPGAGQLFDIVDHQSAQRAIEEILHQGEGLTKDNHNDGDHELAHFWKFHQVKTMWDTGVLTNADVYPIVASPSRHVANYSPQQLKANVAFNREYSRMLDGLQATLTKDAEPDVYPVAAGRMRHLQQLADELRATGPIPGDPDGRLPGPTFEYVSAEEH